MAVLIDLISDHDGDDWQLSEVLLISASTSFGNSSGIPYFISPTRKTGRMPDEDLQANTLLFYRQHVKTQVHNEYA